MLESGIRGRYSYGWSDPTPRTQTTNFEDLKRVRTEWFGASSPFRGRVDMGMAIRGPVHSEPQVIDAEFKMARDLGLPTILHTGATKRRALSVARLHQGGYLERSTILAHWIGQRDADLDALLSAGCSVSMSPQSDLRTPYDNSFHDSMLDLRQKGVNLCLSIDASMLGAVSMFEQMSTAWYMGVPYLDTQMEKTPFVDFTDVLEMATINGARAMGIDNRVGSLRSGKRADIVLVRATDLNIAPLGEPHGALVKAATVANVDTVICDGRVLKRGGRLVGVDVARIVADAEETLASLRRKAGPNWAPKADKPVDLELALLGACA
jgi:5-methylthioadenosine/S-adenosylhomocysteine deaminase